MSKLYFACHGDSYRVLSKFYTTLTARIFLLKLWYALVSFCFEMAFSSNYQHCLNSLSSCLQFMQIWCRFGL